MENEKDTTTRAGGAQVEAVVMRKIKFSITPNNEIPAFAGYLEGSIREPEAKIVVNIETMVNAIASGSTDISFEEIFTTCVVHEMLHAVQELYHREFDEEEVEAVLMQAAKMHFGDSA